MRAALEAFGPEGGDVVNTASLSGLGPVPGLSVYAATKAAVVSLSTSVHAETPRNVRVHALCPDGVDTAMVDGMDPRGMAQGAGPLRGRAADGRRGRRGGGRADRLLAGGAVPPSGVGTHAGHLAGAVGGHAGLPQFVALGQRVIRKRG